MGKPTCIVNTDVSCTNAATDCGPNAECIDGFCLCVEGACSGADAKCYGSNNSYEEVGNGQVYKLRNSRWPSFCIYGTAGGYLGVAEEHDNDESKFTILRPPKSGPDDETYYLLYSKKWPEYNIRVHSKTTTRVDSRRRDKLSSSCRDEEQGRRRSSGDGRRREHWDDEEEDDEWRGQRRRGSASRDDEQG